MNIGLAIKRIRKEKDISQRELGRRCVLSQTALSQIEAGIRRPNSSSLKKICKELEIPEAILYLYALEESDVPEKKKDLYKVVYPAVKDMIEHLLAKE